MLYFVELEFTFNGWHWWLQESRRAAQTTLEQLYDAQQERDRQIQALQELNKVAEKRKTLLDELAIRYQAESDQHREQVKTIEEQHREKADTLTAEIEELKVCEESGGSQRAGQNYGGTV